MNFLTCSKSIKEMRRRHCGVKQALVSDVSNKNTVGVYDMESEVETSLTRA